MRLSLPLVAALLPSLAAAAPHIYTSHTVQQRAYNTEQDRAFNPEQDRAFNPEQDRAFNPEQDRAFNPEQDRAFPLDEDQLRAFEVAIEAEAIRLTDLAQSRAFVVQDLSAIQSMAAQWNQAVSQQVPSACDLPNRLSDAVSRAVSRALAAPYGEAEARELAYEIAVARSLRILAVAQQRLMQGESTSELYADFEEALVQRVRRMPRGLPDLHQYDVAVSNHFAQLHQAFLVDGPARIAMIRAELIRQELTVALYRVRRAASADQATQQVAYTYMAQLLIEQARIASGDSSCN